MRWRFKLTGEVQIFSQNNNAFRNIPNKSLTLHKSHVRISILSLQCIIKIPTRCCQNVNVAGKPYHISENYMGTDLNNRVIPFSNTDSDKAIHFRWGSIAAEIVVQENPTGQVTDEVSVL